MYVFVGLGNVGTQYQNNRHNIGFMVVDALIQKYGTGQISQKYHSEYAQGMMGGQKVHLIKPLTYMNKSGVAVSELCNFFKIPPENLVVFHDDLDLPPFEIRVKKGGGAGGHNGLKSIDAHFHKDYHRVRIGIGHPGHKDAVTSWVLGNFKSDDTDNINNICFEIVQKMPLFITENPNEFKIKISKQY